MMIVELFLISQLLSKRVSADIPTVVDPAKPKTIARPRGLGLFELGKIEAITQPVVIPPISGEEYTQWWLDATKGIPITSLPPKAR